jgi:hypothetical protein
MDPVDPGDLKRKARLAVAASRSFSSLAYSTDAMKAAHAVEVKASVPPSRSVVSRTSTVPQSEAVSTQLPPSVPL